MEQYIYGKNTVKSRIEKEADIEEMLLQEGFKDERFLELIKNKYPVKYVKNSYLNKITKNGVHQGVVAKVKTYKTISIDELLYAIKEIQNPLLVMLDGIQDPHNLGAILRTCDAIGVNGVIVPKHRSAPLNSTVAKVSTGAIEFVLVSEVTNLTNTLKRLKEEGFWIVGAEANNSQDYREIDYKMPTVLVVGSEGKGISRLVLDQCDYKIRLPMIGHVNSLNASVATAVLLYQIYGNKNPLNKEE
ncbi:MAG: 23S rRNA (guanosine(2251)-2'-O)-methyltransferase RlmB [Bacilli bacterium]|nr:23S rRNA (guanosine(2251)-2'-O)-methyltransferase RlmB [Bacilli bacterium]